MIKFRIREVESRLDRATDEDEIARLKQDIAEWKRHLHDAEMIEFEERVGFKSMERNHGVWDERWPKQLTISTLWRAGPHKSLNINDLKKVKLFLDFGSE